MCGNGIEAQDSLGEAGLDVDHRSGRRVHRVPHSTWRGERKARDAPMEAQLREGRGLMDAAEHREALEWRIQPLWLLPACPDDISCSQNSLGRE